jgi:UDP-2,3-diacylglucosamine pyrophosphatase LpxH
MGLMQRKFSRLLRLAREPDRRLSLDMAEDRFVLFSDHHKGDGSAADDFTKNQGVYETALDFYSEEGFRLLVLGDSEELWENRYERVHDRYGSLITREIDLAPLGRNQKKIRMWGNHDKEVSLLRFQIKLRRNKHDLHHGVDLRESVCLGPDIFLIHGHQGRFFEDKAWLISRLAVKFIWKTIQRLLHIGIDGPAENMEVREGLEMQYQRWASAQRVLLICGHTHRAIFASQTKYDRLEQQLRDLRRDLNRDSPSGKAEILEKIEALEKEQEAAKSRRGGKAPRSFASPAESALPCYFNTGCCGYTNGITCLEIDRGELRLVKWQRDPMERQVLVRDDLGRILRHIRAGAPLSVNEAGKTTPPFGGKGE